MASRRDFGRLGGDFMRPPWGPKGPRFEPRELGFRDEVILSQQYVEVVDSGDPASSFVKLDQQYIEVVCTFGTPPPVKGKKDDPPGKVRKQQDYLARRWRELARRATIRGTRRYGSSSDSTPSYPVPMFLPYSADMGRLRNFRRVIASGNDGHTVRLREG